MKRNWSAVTMPLAGIPWFFCADKYRHQTVYEGKSRLTGASLGFR